MYVNILLQKSAKDAFKQYWKLLEAPSTLYEEISWDEELPAIDAEWPEPEE